MPCKLHRNTLRHTGADKVSHSRPAEVVRDSLQ